MSTICDSCKQPVPPDEGGAKITIQDPSPDFSINAPLPTFRRSPQLDICAACTLTMIKVLNLPPDTFTPRQPPATPDIPSGGLTDEDLQALGLQETPKKAP